MGKRGTLKKLKPSLGATLKVHETPSKRLRNRKVVLEILIESLIANDLETFRDVLVSHLRAVSKTDFARQTGLGRQTVYDILRKTPAVDLRISSLGKLFKALAA